MIDDILQPTSNPLILDILKNSTNRRINLSDYSAMVKSDGTKGCVWCGDPLKSSHPMTKYCKNETCRTSAFVYLNPQSVESRHYLLIKQSFVCAICNFDYRPFVAEAYRKGKERGIYKWDDTKDYTNSITWWLWKAYWPPPNFPSNKAPEVDHIIAITNGGTSLGIENTRVICKECHLNKTKADMKAKRNKPETR